MVLHKFHSMNIYLVELLARNALFCAPPKKLNDPFDCFVNMNIHAIEYYIRTPNFNGHDITDILENYRKLKPWQDFDDEKKKKQIDVQLDDEGLAMTLGADMEMQSNFVNDIIEKTGIGVCSFVKLEEDDTNLMMWAHYANNHNGVRLGFNFNEDTGVKDKLRPVRYEPFIFTLGTRPLEEAFYHKLKYFEGENEVRVINDIPYLFFDKKSLREITFGMNASPNQAYSIMEITKGLGYECKFYFMRKTATGMERTEFMTQEEYDKMMTDEIPKVE